MRPAWSSLGEQIALPARILAVAWRAEVQRSLLGPVEAADVIAKRSGSELDPQVGGAFLSRARELLQGLEAPSIWDAFLASEPPPFELMTPQRTGEVATAFAQYVDIKSPFTLGHSTGVARVAEAAGFRLVLADVADTPRVVLQRSGAKTEVRADAARDDSRAAPHVDRGNAASTRDQGAAKAAS